MRVCRFAILVALITPCVHAQDECAATKVTIAKGKAELAALKDRANPEKTVIYKSPVPLGSAKLVDQNVCRVIQASLIDDFFDNVRREFRNSQIVFLANGEKVQTYPAKTSIEIDSVVIECEGPLKANTPAAIAKAEKELLRFEVFHGDSLLPSTTEILKSPWKENALAIEKTSHLIHVNTMGTPLRDRLTIRVYRDEHYLGCLSGAM